MTTEKRIYVVTNREIEGGDERLIYAANAAQAIRHATQPFSARVASQDDLVRLVKQDVEVEKAK